MSAEAQKPQAVQGLTVLETPVKIDVSDGKLVMSLNSTGLTIPSYSMDFQSVEAIKKFVDHVYRTGLNEGFQTAINKKSDEQIA